MGECGGKGALLSRWGQKQPKSSQSASSGSLSVVGHLPGGQGHHSHLCPSLNIWTKARWAFLGTECRGNGAFPEQGCPDSPGVGAAG